MADHATAPAPFTAAALVQRFLRTDDDSELVLGRRWCRGMRTWTNDESREVLEAAKRCTSVDSLNVDVSGLKGRAAELVPLILGQIKSVTDICLMDNSGKEAGKAGTSAVDTVLRAIMKSPSKVKYLELFNCVCDPHVFIEVCDKYRDALEELYMRRGRHCSYAFSAFALSVAMSWGLLTSLRHVAFNFGSLHPSIPCLLATLHNARAVDTLDVWIGPESARILKDVALMCCCTQTVERVRFGSRVPHVNRALNMYASFDVGFSKAFSATIKEVSFLHCAFRDDEGGSYLDRTATALQHVEFLILGSCHFPSLFSLLERLPRLTTLSIVSRTNYRTFSDHLYEGEDFDDEEHEEVFSDSKRLLADDDDLHKLCRVIGRPESALVDVELDVLGRRGAVVEEDGRGNDASYSASFPAMDELLRCAKGRLVLNCVELPWESHHHILGGVERLSRKLNDLSLRFHDCRIADEDCATMVRALRTIRTLTKFEIRLGVQVTPERSINAILELVHANSSLQVLSLPDLGSDAPTVLERILPSLTVTNRSLRVLKLHGADMANDWPRLLEPMKKMLEVNHVISIRGLHLPTDDAVASEVGLTLDLNWFGRRFWTANDASTKMIWAKVLERIAKDKDHQVMFKFLRAKPSWEPVRSGLKRPRPVEDVGPA